MQAGELISLIKHPETLKKEDVAQLERLTIDFPYFQSARLLLCMAARRWDTAVYQQQLKRTAIAASNRGHLYDLVNNVERMMQFPVPEPLPAKTAEDEKPRMRDLSTEEELQIVNASAEAKVQVPSSNTKALPSSIGEILPDDFLEKEIRKQQTAAVVDKEIISAEKSPAVEAEQAVQAQPSEPGSFSDWLEQLKKTVETDKPTLRKKKELQEPLPASHTSVTPDQQEEALKAKRNKQKALIDKIIESSPGVIRPKEDQKFFTPERKAKESLLENEHLVTETLAKIYAMQGNISKAIRSYEILSLKYPQKSAYFASLIQKLKQNQ